MGDVVLARSRQGREMEELSPAETFEVLCLRAADEGRGPVLFGDCVSRARSVLRPFFVSPYFPSVYLEFPLLGDPFLDVTVLYGRLDAGMRIDSPAAQGTDPLFDWYGGIDKDVGDVSLGFELDTSKAQVPEAAVHFQPRDHDELVRPFFATIGEPDRADAYFELMHRLPAGWRPQFCGLFRGRPGSPLRVCGYLGANEKKACAEDPHQIEGIFEDAGFSAINEEMLDQMHELMRVASVGLDYQFDIYPDGTLGDTFAFDVQFKVETPRAVHDSFREGPAAQVMQLLEGWGIADKRWEHIPQAAFARALPVERENGEIARYSLTLMPGWAKVRWRNGVLQPSKFYLYAAAGFLEKKNLPSKANS